MDVVNSSPQHYLIFFLLLYHSLAIVLKSRKFGEYIHKVAKQNKNLLKPCLNM